MNRENGVTGTHSRICQPPGVPLGVAVPLQPSLPETTPLNIREIPFPAPSQVGNIYSVIMGNYYSVTTSWLHTR
jgi:hypothetical protein